MEELQRLQDELTRVYNAIEEVEAARTTADDPGVYYDCVRALDSLYETYDNVSREVEQFIAQMRKQKGAAK